MNNALELTGLTKRYPGFTLDHLTFSLPEGCIMGLIGENGAGKTTAFKLMLGLARPDEGGAHLLGRATTDRETKEHLGVVMDECGFPENLTLHDVDAIMSRCYRTWDTLRFQGWADRFELPRKKAVKAFSRGMRMKLSIAVALSHDSRLLLLDEATSGLDPVVRDEMLDVLRDFIQNERRSVLLSSHIISDLEKVCDYVTFLHKGRLLLSEAKDDLLDRYVLAKAPEAELRRIDPASVVGLRAGRFGAEALILRRALPGGMAHQPATLEDIMLYHIKEEH